MATPVQRFLYVGVYSLMRLYSSETKPLSTDVSFQVCILFLKAELSHQPPPPHPHPHLPRLPPRNLKTIIYLVPEGKFSLKEV